MIVVADTLTGVERVVLIVSMLEFPVRLGITLGGENEYVTPAGRMAMLAGVSDKVTGLGGLESLSVSWILVEPELPLMTSTSPELDSI